MVKLSGSVVVLVNIANRWRGIAKQKIGYHNGMANGIPSWLDNQYGPPSLVELTCSPTIIYNVAQSSE